MAKKKQEIAACIQDGLIAYLLQQWAPDQLDTVIERELDAFLAYAGRTALSEWVDAEQVFITARKYAVEMPISGAIPELVGDMVDSLYGQAVHSQRTLAEVVNEDVVEAFIDKVLEIPLSRRGMAWLGSNPVLLALLAGGAQLGVKTLLHQGLPGPLRAQLVKRLPAQWLSGLEVRLQEWLLARTEQLLSDPYLYRDENLDELRDLVLLAWQEFAQQPVAEFRELVSSEDIQELFVIGFDYWRELRDTDYFDSLLRTGVDAFFEKYQDATLLELLTEMGVTRELMIDDARRFLPPVVERLRSNGVLEATLTRQIEGYFTSPALAELLAEGE